MAVNISKTKFIVFKPKGMQANLDDDNWIYYDDTEICKPIDPNKIT
jgi:hypothetical protein